MSQPRTPFAEVEASLDKAKRTWIKEMLAALSKSESVTSTSADTSAQPVNLAPLLRGGVPVGPYEKLLEQQRLEGIDLKPSADNAVEKIEAKRQANEANNQAVKEDKPWSFEDAMRNKYEDLPPVFQFPARKPLTLGPDEYLRVDDNAYDKLPNELKSKMSGDVWKAIKGQRAKLFTIFMRLREYGAWDAVSKVTGIKEQLPPHGKLGAVNFGIYGTGGIAFEEKKVGGVAAILVGTGHFGQDNKIMALWHQGQKSYREWRKEQITPAGVLDESIHEWGQKTAPPPSSLHLSTGPGILFDAHIDRISPVAKPVDGQSVPNTDAGEHIGTEAIGPTIYGVTPAVTMKKDKDAKYGVNATIWINYRLEWDIPSGDSKKRKKAYNPRSPQLEPLPEDLRNNIC